MIDILIPIGEFPLFPLLNILNIKETIGIEKYKINFLISEITPRIKNEFEKYKYDFNLIEFNVGKDRGSHLKLLDFAFRNLKLSDWVYVQHSDMFWESKNWFQFFSNLITSDVVAITPSYCSKTIKFKEIKYSLNEKPLIRTHDFCGLYKKDFILDNNLTFSDGIVSDFNDKYKSIFLNSIKTIKNNQYLKLDSYLDGSDYIGLFIQQSKYKIKQIENRLEYYHCWDLFGIPWCMSKCDNVINIERKFDKAIRSIESYSYLSSFLFDYDAWKDKVLPWFVVKQIMNVSKNDFCTFFENYVNMEKKSIKSEYDGTKLVKFLDRKFNIYPGGFYL